MDQALNSQKTPHTSPLRASYGMSFVSILMKNDRVIKGFYCTLTQWGLNKMVHILTHWGPDKMAAIFQKIFQINFLIGNVWISIRISLKFVPKGPIDNIPALVQIMAWRRPGDKPLSESIMVSLLTHICFNRPQWVKASSHHLNQWWPRSLTLCGVTRLQPVHVVMKVHH